MIDLFGTKPRRARRVMMKFSDVGICANGYGDDVGKEIARFECGKCGHKTDWLVCENVTEVKRGIPCPNCNEAA